MPKGREVVNPLHPGLPPVPQQGEEHPDNPDAKANAGARQRDDSDEVMSEEYIRKMTGGRYKTAKDVWKAKQETDNAYHRDIAKLQGKLEALQEQMASVQSNAMRPPQDNPGRMEALANRLEELGYDPSVMGVFQEIATSAVMETLAPIARGQEERMRALSTHPDWARREGELFEFLANNPEEQHVFQTLLATDQKAAYKYGFRALAEGNAQAQMSESQGDAEEAEMERKHALTHGQVIGQKHRASEGTLQLDRRDQTDREYEAWQKEAYPGSMHEEYLRERLSDVASMHPELRRIREEAEGS